LPLFLTLDDSLTPKDKLVLDSADRILTQKTLKTSVFLHFG
jgi:hypothetical protein